MEDPNGGVVLICVYNFPGLFQATIKMLDAYIPPGTMMAIREPWYKISGGDAARSSAFIRVDSPSDIIILDPSHPILQGITWKGISMTSPVSTTAEMWRGVGNRYFKDGLFIPAALAWSRGLSVDPSAYILRLNRAQAYVKLGWFSAALSDALHIASESQYPQDSQRKALYRVATAEYGLGRYIDTLETLDRFDSLQAHGDPAVSSLRSRSRQRLEEMDGRYVWTEMFEAGQVPVPHLDVADLSVPP